MEIEGFNLITETLALVKKLYDTDRHDVIAQFPDLLSWDNCYEAALITITSLFSNFSNTYEEYDGCYEVDVNKFKDKVISDYFLYAGNYGRLYKLPHSQNPYVIRAKAAAHEFLSISYCFDWKLLGYTWTKRAARRSKLIISFCDCGCCGPEQPAYGLIRLYAWFRDRCGEFKALNTVRTTAGSRKTYANEKRKPRNNSYTRQTRRPWRKKVSQTRSTI